MIPVDVVAVPTAVVVPRSSAALLFATLFLAIAVLSPSVAKVAVEKPHQTVATPGCAAAVWIGGAKLCCQGKNNKCRTEGPRISNNGSVTCFCDSDCFALQDCCTDYKETCLPTDCVVGDWGEWSDCDVRCGTGVRQRTRPIVTPPMNGGQACPPTVEKSACDGTKCKYPRAPGGIEELREAGKLLPAVFGPWRNDKTYNPYMDIRKNLFDHYDPKSPSSERPTYCAEFVIDESRPACQSPTSAAPWTRPLAEGARVCVECQPVAMRSKLGGRCRGHGVLGKQTRWNAATAPGCNGLWTMKTPHSECRCSTESRTSFILI